MKTFLAFIGLCCLGFIGLCFFLVIASNRIHSSDSGPSTSTPLSSSSQEEPTHYVTFDNLRYPIATASNVAVTVQKVATFHSFFHSYETVRADGKFVAVRVIIMNRQRDEITMSTSLFKLLALDGTEYSASEKSLEVGGDEELFLKGINPGITMAGIILFDIPTDVDVSSLRLSFRGGMTGQESTLPLNEVGVQVGGRPTPATPLPAREAASTAESQPTAPAKPEPMIQEETTPAYPAPIVRDTPSSPAPAPPQ